MGLVLGSGFGSGSVRVFGGVWPLWLHPQRPIGENSSGLTGGERRRAPSDTTG
ncbi:membrane protein [Pyrococcus abyssi virus 1]|uniref:membrane protein n=1 Tax=Pyrococcus abyssi virus 1 TaxID=425386 RepID=UPI00015529AF|nr:membrane protein [Pyrococcus abyssi virus 1]ABN58486.1 membrane protein [Pyrococcus abyssi virus 1]